MTTSDAAEGIQAAIEAAQLRAAANQYRLKLRLHQQSLKQLQQPRPQR
jgi:hypothetical protein